MDRTTIMSRLCRVGTMELPLTPMILPTKVKISTMAIRAATSA